MNLSNRPRVGIITKNIDEATSGSGMHNYNITKRLLKLNHSIDFYLIHYKKTHHKIYNRSKEIIIPKNPIIASHILKKYKLCLIHYFPLTIFSPIWIKNVIKIATIHGGAPYFIPSKVNFLHLLHAKYISPFLAKKMDYIFTVSNASKQFIIKTFGVKNNKIGIISNAVDKDFRVIREKEKLQTVKKKNKIDGNFILHISKFSERKNPWVLLKAFKYILNSDKIVNKPNLVVIGKGWKNKKVLSFIMKNGLKEKTLLTGFIKKEAIISLLNLAEVFVFSSLYEGFGIPNIEAMACGCPVITSKSFAIPEIVGDSAILVDNVHDHIELANAIIELIKNKNLKEKLIMKGFKKARSYSWDRSVNEVLRTYHEYICNKKIYSDI